MDKRELLIGVTVIKVALLAGAVFAIVTDRWILLAVLAILRFSTSLVVGGILVEYWRDWRSSDDGNRDPDVDDVDLGKLSTGLSTREADPVSEDEDTRSRADKSPIFGGQQGSNRKRRRRR